MNEKKVEQDLFEYILNVSRQMAETRMLTPLLNYVLDEAIKLIGAERGYIVLVKADGSLDFRVKRTQNGKQIKGAEDQISKSILNKAIDAGQPLILHDALSDPRFGEAESVITLGLRSIMCVPLITRGETIGAIYVENRSIRGRFSDDDLKPLIVLANQAAVAIENAALIEELEMRVAARTKELESRTQELEQTKMQVEKSWTEAVEANRVRTVWLSQITHDLRAPLGIASASLSFLQEGGLGPLTPNQLEWIEKSLKIIYHISDLTNDLFDLSRLELGGITLQKETVSTQEFLENVYGIGRGFSWPQSVKFKLDTPPALPDIFVDPARMRQVLLNLIANAYKFTSQGSVTLYARHLTGRNEMLLGVADTGEGIAADKLGLLFERFQQVDPDPKRRRQGAGLGLAICRELVEMHGGRIWVKSTPGLGSNFQFTLPLINPTSPLENTVASSQ